uniref:DUF1758 domain-containing protein n=1 Tax=Angiostrongylus cantonensis TaxID=6313 RepID=A0A0K0CYH4_ANGCA
MSNTLSSRLGALTKAINRLKSSLNKYDQEVNSPVNIPSNEPQRTEYFVARKDDVKQATSAITKQRDSLEAALDDYTKAADNFELQTSIPDELKEGIQLNVNKTLEHIDKAENYLSKLLELRNKLDSTQRNAQNDSHTAPPATNLPPIPIPNFSGDIWEWETFWGEFEHSVHSRAQIWAAQAIVLNPDKTKKEVVEVLLDTAADRSLITNDLAETLQLKDAYSTELAIHKFGDSKADMKKYGITSIILQDTHGAEHEIAVNRTDTITQPLKRCSFSVEDQEFLHRNSISLSIDSTRSTIHPKILLGSGDVQKVLDKGIPLNNTLPSGLTLIPSRLRYLVTGTAYKQQNEPDIDIVPAASTTQVSYKIIESEKNTWAFDPLITNLWDPTKKSYNSKIWRSGNNFKKR